MEQSIKKYNEHVNAGLAFSLLCLMGSFLSVINMIPFFITCQLLQQAHQQGFTNYKEKLIILFLIVSLLLTLYMTLLYTKLI